jgi:hypothetical protein
MISDPAAYRRRPVVRSGGQLLRELSLPYRWSNLKAAPGAEQVLAFHPAAPALVPRLPA